MRTWFLGAVALAAIAAALVPGEFFASANGVVRLTPVAVVTAVQSNRIVTTAVFSSDDGAARLAATPQPK